MTITEYLNQEDPKRMPKVYLQEEDVNLYRLSNLAGFQQWEVHIKAFPEYRYSIKVNLSGHKPQDWITVYTTDHDLNHKSPSCFYCKIK